MPTTTYRSARGLAPALAAADATTVVPGHAHTPLAVMLVLFAIYARVRAARALLLIALLSFAANADAQLRAEIYVSGLTHPLGFIQDPSNPASSSENGT